MGALLNEGAEVAKGNKLVPCRDNVIPMLAREVVVLACEVLVLARDHLDVPRSVVPCTQIGLAARAKLDRHKALLTCRKSRADLFEDKAVRVGQLGWGAVFELLQRAEELLGVVWCIESGGALHSRQAKVSRQSQATNRNRAVNALPSDRGGTCPCRGR